MSDRRVNVGQERERVWFRRFIFSALTRQGEGSAAHSPVPVREGEGASSRTLWDCAHYSTTSASPTP